MEQITLNALEAALAPIEAIGKSETTFNVQGTGPSNSSTTITLRILLPEEEILAQRYASKTLAGVDEDKSHDALEYVEHFKMAILSYSIVSIGSLDLHEVEYIETGETLENGQKVKEPKHLAVRNLLFRWAQDIRTRVFNKYNELLLKVELDAEKAIKFDPVDLDTEIERVEKRLDELKKVRDKDKSAGGTTVIREQIKDISEQDKQDTKNRRDAVDIMAAKRAGIPITQPDEDAPDSISTPNSTPEPIFHGVSSPPPERPVEPQIDSVTQDASQSQLERPVTDEEPSLPVWEDDSFVDSSDADGMKAAIYAENQKLLAARRGKLPPDPSALNTMRAQQSANGVPVMRPGATPPHMGAKDVADELESEETRILNASRKTMVEPTEKLGDVDVYRSPAEVLDRVEPVEATQQAVLNKGPANQSVNPRFKPVKKEL